MTYKVQLAFLTFCLCMHLVVSWGSASSLRLRSSETVLGGQWGAFFVITFHCKHG